MRALFVSYSGLLGGAERLLLDVAKGLDDSPGLACPDGPLADAAEAAGLPRLVLSTRSLKARDPGGPGQVAGHALELRRLARNLRPRVLVAWSARPAVAAAAALRGLAAPPALVAVLNDLAPGWGDPLGAAVRAAVRRAERVVCVSQAVAAAVDPGGRLGDRLRVIYPGVDLTRFRPAPFPEEPTVVWLGAIVDWKRPDLALEAVAHAGPPLRLVLAGAPIPGEGGALLESLRRRAARPDLAGRVELPGNVDAPRALRHATCLLHTAEREPFGMAVAEALAAGRPAVAPAAGGPAEIVDPGSGALYPPGDAAAAAKALAAVLEDVERLGAGARRRAESHFDADRSHGRFRAVLDELAPHVPRERPLGLGVTVLTVTHESRPELERLLRSVARHLPGARVVVVDNASSDGGADAARGWGGPAEVIELEENVGFGRAVNRGLEDVTEPVVVLANPDVELVDASLARLAADAGAPGGAHRILAPLVLARDGSRQDYAQPEPGTAAALATAALPSPLLPRPAAPWRCERPRRVGWAAAACLVARADLLRSLGPFDERAFMYAEDLDLGLRASDAGVETWFRPDARVLHAAGHSARRAFGGEPVDLLASRRRAVVRERRGPARGALDEAARAATHAGRAAAKGALGREAAPERARLAALRRARRER